MAQLRDPTTPRGWGSRAVRCGAAVFLSCGGAALVLWCWLGGWGAASGDSPPFEPVDQPVIQTAPALPAGSAGLRDDDEVIGVAAGGRHRAYLVAALAPVELHVVNDELGGVPVTVAYCDRTDCVHAYTGPHGKGPLDIGVGGYLGVYDAGSMVLRVGSQLYRQDTGLALGQEASPFPYAETGFERTTWKAWRAAHPDTDVYVGPSSADADKAP
jgi:hypothetical protein